VRDEVPEVPLAQDDRVAVEARRAGHRRRRRAEGLVQRNAAARAGEVSAAARVTIDVVALEVRAEQNRSRRRRRARQPAFRAPEEQVVADQEVLAHRLAQERAVVVVVSLEAADRAEAIRTDRPLKARHEEVRPSSAHVLTRVEQRLAAAVAVVLEAEAVTSDVGGIAALDAAEPAADFEADALQPLALDLRERLDFQVEGEVAAGVHEAAETVVALADAAHDHLELTDSARNAHPLHSDVTPRRGDRLARAAGVKAVVAREKIVLHLAARARRALAIRAQRAFRVRAEGERRHPRGDLL